MQSKNIFKTSAVIFTLTVITLSTLQTYGAATVTCRESLIPVGLYRGLKAEYIETNFTNNKRKVVEVSNQAPIMNQGVRGFCFMYSWFEQMIHTYKTEHNGESPGVSLYYVAYHHWLRRAVDVAQNSKGPVEIPEGGGFEPLTDLIRDVGFLSEADWANVGGKTDIEVRSKNIVELGQLKSLVTKAHLEKNLILTILEPGIPETNKPKTSPGKYYDSILQNTLLKDQIRIFVLKKQKQLKNGQTNLTADQVKVFANFLDGRTSTLDLRPSEIKKIFHNLDLDIENEIKSEFNFMFFGKATNPLEKNDLHKNRELARKIYPNLDLPTVTLTADGSRKGLSEYAGRDKNHLIFMSSFESMLQVIKQKIDAGIPVYVGYDHESYFADDTFGALTVEGMASTPEHPYLTRTERKLTQTKPSGHGTQFVGYEVDGGGNIVALKMQNSWGPLVGKSGYYRMDLSFFRAFVLRISFFDTEGIFTPEMIKKLDIRLNPIGNRPSRLPK